MYLPGLVTHCEIRESSGGRRLRYLTCRFFLGGVQEKVKEVGIQCTKIRPPDGCFHPERILAYDIDTHLSQTTLEASATQLSQELEEAMSDLPIHRVSDSSAGVEMVDCHGVEWSTDQQATLLDCNGAVPFRNWSCTDPIGNVYGPSCDPNGFNSRMDYLRMVFPAKAFRNWMELTNERLIAKGRPPMDEDTGWCFLGLIIMATRFEFSSRQSLWSSVWKTKYQPPPDFGKSGMSRNRFNDIWECSRWSFQPEERPPHVSSEDYRWMLVDDFVAFFNEHREKFFNPSSDMCADESMSRWYGLGGDWINLGLPMYVALDRKPEHGCEIQNLCDGQSGIMLRLLLVKSRNSLFRRGTDSAEADDDESLNHGTQVLKYLVQPWARTNRVVYADSFFASVQSARELYRMGLRFTGVVKTATKGFPYAQLSSKQFGGKGEWFGYFHDGDNTAMDPDMLAFGWVDRDRRYFISTVSNLRPAPPIMRDRWRQVDRTPDAEPSRESIVISQPNCSKNYYENCGMIDRHNRIRQDDLAIEKKLGTLDWSRRVNLSIFSMCVVDAFLLHRGCTGSKESPDEFFSKLAEEMIESGRVARATREAIRQADELAEARKRSIASGLGPHLTPNKKRRKSPGKENGGGNKVLNQASQKRCSYCHRKTTWICSQCNDETDKVVGICHTKTRSECWEHHMESFHGVCNNLHSTIC